MKLTLTARAPFSLDAVIGSHGWIQLAPFDTNADRSKLSYVTRLATGRIVALEIFQKEQGIAIHLAGDLNAGEQIEVLDQVTWMLGLHQDFSEFYTLIADEPKLAQ